MAEVDWLVETVASRATAPDAETPNNEIKAKPINGKSPFNFFAKTRHGLMAYLIQCFLKKLCWRGSGNVGDASRPTGSS